MQNLRLMLLIPACLTVIGCSEQTSEPAAMETAPPATDVAEPQAHTLPPRTPAPALAAVFFITPADGDTVPNPVRVEFGLDGMAVVSAGVDEVDSGHHHLLVDTDLPDLSLPIPKDHQHIHFGDGSISTELTLAPGEHTLRLLLGDHLHIPHDPPVMSDPITITVE